MSTNPCQYGHKFRGDLHESTKCSDCQRYLHPGRLEIDQLTGFGKYVPMSSPDYKIVADRDNKDKPDYTLIPPAALEAEARLWMFGQKKYGRDNWRKFWGDDTMNVILASAMRHLIAMQRGEIIDPDSGLPHAAAVRCNMAMALEYQKDKK